MRTRSRNIFSLIWLLLLPLLSACNTLRFVPEGEYLLDKANVRVLDTKEVTHDDLKSYRHQRPNTKIFGFWKLQLGVYSLAKPDSSKWINRTLWKMGEKPEVFDPTLADFSRQQIERAMFNKGYFNATVDTTMRIKNRKVDLSYCVTARAPYTLRSYSVRLDQPDLRQIATDSRRSLISEGMQYNADLLNEERTRITQAMRRRGYYYFDREYLRYVVDSAYNNNTASVVLCLQDYVQYAEDTLRAMLFQKFTIRDVRFYMDVDPAQMSTLVDVETRQGYSFAYQGQRMLRSDVLVKNCLIRPGQLYNFSRVERTYAALNALGPVKYVEISFEQVGDDELSCIVVLSRDKYNSISTELEGTFSAGDWGLTGGVGYANRNLFHGAEQLTINANAGYEWRQQGGRALEAKAEVGLAFPDAPKIALAYHYQNRPEEFTRTIAQMNLSYNYHPYLSNWRFQFDFLDLSYVYLPWISEEFSDYFLQSRNLLKYSYEDHFILGWSVSGNYSSFRKNQPLRSYMTFHFSAETAGNLLYGLSYLCRLPRDEEDGAFKLFNIRYAQYAKADMSLTYNEIFNAKHRLVYHAALGVAVPFGNAAAIPFEKRYFAGGANSVRGWQIRSLGPGAYRGLDNRIDYNNQAGDIKLDLNLEYRWKVWSIVELAAFTDAGNIWTMHDYESQPHGVFRLNEFYKQIAWSYGAGVRLDFSFFIFRFDLGVKLYDPSRLYYDQKPWRTAANGLRWKDDFTCHFAIGYPF